MFGLQLDDAIELRILEKRDAEALFELTDSCRDYLRQWLPWVDDIRKIDDTKEFIAATLRQFASGDGAQAGIWSDGQLAGVIGHHYLDLQNKRTSLGYWLGESFQGRGIMTRCCRYFVNHAFSQLGLHRVEIRCAVDNQKSRAIPERLGFELEGVLRHNEVLYERVVDHAVYSMLAEQWERK